MRCGFGSSGDRDPDPLRNALFDGTFVFTGPVQWKRRHDRMDPIWCCLTCNFYDTPDRREQRVSRNMLMVSQLAQAGGIVQPGEFFDLDLKRMFQESVFSEVVLRLVCILQENGVEFEPVINDVAANTLFWYKLRQPHALRIMKHLVAIGCIDPMRTQWPWNTGDSTWQGHLLRDVKQANGRWVTCIVGAPPQVLLQDTWLYDDELQTPMEIEPAFTKVSYPRGTSLYEMAETDLKIQRELDDAMKIYSGTINAYQISLTQTPLSTGPRSIVARYLCRSTTYATCG